MWIECNVFCLDFYDNRAATDMSSRMLLSKRNVMGDSGKCGFKLRQINVFLGRLPIRPKFSATGEHGHPSITMRSRTPNAVSSSKANSQRSCLNLFRM